MKSNLLKIMFLSLVLATVFISCKKEDADVRDKYVGTWKYVTVGSVNVSIMGQQQTQPVAESGTASITKSGEKDLLINGLIFTLSGNSLSAEPQTESMTQDGITANIITTYSGTVASASLITINSTITGTVLVTGLSGNVTGNSISTFTK
jgi:hypothetical protein